MKTAFSAHGCVSDETCLSIWEWHVKFFQRPVLRGCRYSLAKGVIDLCHTPPGSKIYLIFKRTRLFRWCMGNKHLSGYPFNRKLVLNFIQNSILTSFSLPTKPPDTALRRYVRIKSHRRVLRRFSSNQSNPGLTNAPNGNLRPIPESILTRDWLM